MKQFQSFWMMAPRLKLYSRAKLSALGCALVVLGVMLTQGEGAIVQQQPSALDDRKAQLEVQKLEFEVKRLAEDRRELWGGWSSGVLGLLVGVAGTAATIWGARRARRGALDQSVHDKRLESYPRLVNTAAGLALYFPPAKSVTPDGCREMGEAMRAWYFKGGGLLMSTEARDGYFALARGLTRASLAGDLRVPMFPKDADHISVEAVDKYRDDLATLDLDNVDKWNFGGAESEMERPSLRFKDFVFLQSLSSALRTRLCEDLHSRRRPS